MLVLDDDPGTLELVEAIAINLGCDVTSSTDAAEALSRARELDPHIVVLDIGYPGLPSDELARRLHGAGVRARLVVMSASPRALAVAARMNADGFIMKPFDLHEMESALRRALSSETAGSS